MVTWQLGTLPYLCLKLSRKLIKLSEYSYISLAIDELMLRFEEYIRVIDNVVNFLVAKPFNSLLKIFMDNLLVPVQN